MAVADCRRALSYAVAGMTVMVFPGGREAILRDIGFAKSMLTQWLRKGTPSMPNTVM